MSGVLIAPALPGDARAVGAILSDWVDEAGWLPRVHTRAEDQDNAADLVRRGWVRVLRHGVRVAGFLARDGGEIHALYVDRGLRGRGIGAALLRDAQARAPRLALWAHVANRRARVFYLRHGFTEVGRSDGAGNDEHLPDIRYQWSRP